ncbi:MAG: DNA topoisomerase III [Oscillospiraceae bacterium]|nr:DNA topoisomerase III [Oscillospiraceae bacterium]
MKLILAEKPELGKAIAAAICDKPVFNRDGSILCGEYIVISAFGHLFRLKQPEEYDMKYKKWTRETLPIFFENWQITPDPSKINRVNTIGNLLGQADEVIHAGDPDDEGQLLIDEILEYFQYKGNVMRLSTNDNNPDYIRKQLGKMESNTLHLPNGYSARARSVADFIVGINYSRFFTLSNRTRDTMNIGRVQTPTLGLVVARDMLIENHTKLNYYELFVDLDGELEGVKAKFYPNPDSPVLDENGKVLDRTMLEKTLNYLRKQPLEVKVEKAKAKEKPPLPFNQVELQTYCGNKFGYSLEETSKAAQDLREIYKAITYNRSSSRYLNEEHYADAPRVVNAVLGITGFDLPDLDLGIKSSCFRKVKEPHHAIIPTGTRVDLNKLTEVQKNVYLAICMYYLAQFLPEAVDSKTTLTAMLKNNNSVKAQSLLCDSQGWRRYFKEKNTESSPLDNVPAGDYTVNVTDGQIKEIETKPPKRYTEITLNKDMTSVAKYVKDAEIRELLLRKDKDSDKDKGSIGTESTRTAIITNLINRGYIAKKGKNLISTQKGRELYNCLPDEIKKPDMTAKWWAIQEKIKENEATPQDLYNDVLQTVNKIISQRYSFAIGKNRFDSPPKYQESIVGTCPRCGAEVVEYAKSYTCVNWPQPHNCKFVIWKQPIQFKQQGVEIDRDTAHVLLRGDTAPVAAPLVQKQLEIRMDDSAKSQYGANFVVEKQTDFPQNETVQQAEISANIN